MFKIVSNTHRVTNYVREEAYKWLYKEIDRNKYVVSKKPAAMKLMLKIKTDRCMTAETYEKFIGMMENSPFVYLIRKKNKSGLVTTNHIRNYFVLFNDDVLPLGFIMDFFEDEYETKAERNKLIDDYLKSQNKEEFVNHCKTKIFEKVEPTINFKERHPNIFNTAYQFFVSHGIKIFISLLILALFLGFTAETKLFGVLGDWMDDDFNLEESLDKSYGIIDTYGVIFNAKLTKDEGKAIEKAKRAEAEAKAEASDAEEAETEEKEKFEKEIVYGPTYSEYFYQLRALLIFNSILLIYLLFRLGYIISIAIVTIKALVYKSKLTKLDKHIELLEGSGIEDLKEYFISITPEARSADAFTDDMVSNLPEAHKSYQALVDFDFNKLENQINDFSKSEKAQKFGIAYSNSNVDMAVAKKAWRSGFVFVSIVLLLAIVFNFEPLYLWVLPTISMFF